MGYFSNLYEPPEREYNGYTTTVIQSSKMYDNYSYIGRADGQEYSNDVEALEENTNN